MGVETERKRAFIIDTIYFLIWAAIFTLAITGAFSLLMPFVIALAVAYVLRRPARFLHKKLHLPYKPVALLLVLLTYFAVGWIFSWVGVRLFGVLVGVVEQLPHLYNVHFLPVLNDLILSVEESVSRLDPSLMAVVDDFADQFIAWMASWVSGISAWAVSTVSGIATSIPGLFVKLVLMVIATVFITMDYDRLLGFVVGQMNARTRNLFFQIKNYLVGTLFVCVASYVIIMSLTFTELSIGFNVIGLEHPFLFAAGIAVFDILPVLGTGGIMIPAAVISLVTGEVALGIELLILYAIVTVVRNIVEPKFVGSQLGLHPVVTLSSMFAGVQLFGVVGLFGFPIGLSLIRYLNDNGSIHILKPAASKEKTPEDADKTIENSQEVTP